eukprot:Colp12_sorted_trinity150504_noHs@2758
MLPLPLTPTLLLLLLLLVSPRVRLLMFVWYLELPLPGVTVDWVVPRVGVLLVLAPLLVLGRSRGAIIPAPCVGAAAVLWEMRLVVVRTLGPLLFGLLLFCTNTSASLRLFVPLASMLPGDGSERGVAGMLLPAKRSSSSLSTATTLALALLLVVAVEGRLAVLFWLVVLLLALTLLMLLKWLFSTFRERYTFCRAMGSTVCVLCVRLGSSDVSEAPERPMLCMLCMLALLAVCAVCACALCLDGDPAGESLLLSKESAWCSSSKVNLLLRRWWWFSSSMCGKVVLVPLWILPLWMALAPTFSQSLRAHVL